MIGRFVTDKASWLVGLSPTKLHDWSVCHRQSFMIGRFVTGKASWLVGLSPTKLHDCFLIGQIHLDDFRSLVTQDSEGCWAGVLTCNSLVITSPGELTVMGLPSQTLDWRRASVWCVGDALGEAEESVDTSNNPHHYGIPSDAADG